jgi:methyl-accepting chemotaxis protein
VVGQLPSVFQKPASALVLEDDRVPLRELITEALSFRSVLYIIVEDVSGEIVSETLNGDVPEKLRSANAFSGAEGQEREAVRVLELAQFGSVYDIIVPIDEGFVGFVRVGMDKSFVETIIAETLFYLLLFMLSALIIAVIGAIFLANRITRPVLFLTESADKISMGDLDSPVVINSNDEIGELAKAIERMRESLKAAIDRLRKRQQTSL